MHLDIHKLATVPDQLSGLRLDQIAVKLFPEFSRERLKRWITEGALTVDDQVQKPGYRLRGHECLILNAKLVDQQQWQAKEHTLDIVYQDEHLIIVNKPINCVVHPAPGHYDDTLVNALLYVYPELNTLPRAGVVHRLDKDTSGVMMVARSLIAHPILVAQLQERAVSRIYQALVYGQIPDEGTIETKMARDPHQRTRMAVTEQGKTAITHYRCIKRYDQLSLVELSLETGRTHQIRVHLQHLGFPIVGDPVYRRGQTLSSLSNASVKNAIKTFNRQALHAKQLKLMHPLTQTPMEFNVPVATDIVDLLGILEQGG